VLGALAQCRQHTALCIHEGAVLRELDPIPPQPPGFLVLNHGPKDGSPLRKLLLRHRCAVSTAQSDKNPSRKAKACLVARVRESRSFSVRSRRLPLLVD
jgi:hypothetical protein